MAKEMMNGSKSGKGVKYFKDAQKGFDIASKIDTKEIKPKGFEGEFQADKPLSIKEVGNNDAKGMKK